MSGRFSGENTGGAQNLPAGSSHSGLWHTARGKLRLRDGEDDERGRGPLQVRTAVPGDPWAVSGEPSDPRVSLFWKVPR